MFDVVNCRNFPAIVGNLNFPRDLICGFLSEYQGHKSDIRDNYGMRENQGDIGAGGDVDVMRVCVSLRLLV